MNATTLRRKVERIVQAYERDKIHLCGYGNSNLEPRTDFDYARVRELLSIIPRFYQKTHRQGKQSSYGMKHEMERFLASLDLPRSNTYVSNGTMIVAMLLSGFNPRFTGVNCTFNVKKRTTPEKAGAYLLVKHHVGSEDLAKLIAGYIPEKRSKIPECEMCDRRALLAGRLWTGERTYMRFCSRCAVSR